MYREPHLQKKSDECAVIWREWFKEKFENKNEENIISEKLQETNKNDDDLGGHISTFSSAATLYDIGFNYFFRGSNDGLEDLIYFQGHSSPGIYARSFLEGYLNEEEIGRAHV